jgi:hypothetical protein
MIADAFSIDVYCAYLNLPLAEEFLDESEGNRSMNHETSTARLSVRSRDISRPSHKPGYVLPRLLWMAVGPGVMMVLTVLKLESRSDQPGSIDAAFFAVAVAIVFVRWVTWLAGDKCDSFGGKAGFPSLLGFTAIVAVLAGGFWTLATLIATQQLAP